MFQVIGDAFCAAFATATDALISACAAQRALYLEFGGGKLEVGGETPLPSNLPLPTSNLHPPTYNLQLRVRMGLHTGAAETREGVYRSNLTLIRAQRIMAAGHGGQILVSLATEELVHDHLPQDASLRDLGTHRLKGLDRPERIFQLVVAELPANFSPLRVLESSTAKHETTTPPMLPSERSIISPVLIGRATSLQTLEELIAQVRHGKGQPILIAGEAGIGKSRLVAETKARFSAQPHTLVMQGRCFEHDRALPYAPLLDLLRLYFAGRTPADAQNDLGPTAPELVKLLPELCTRLPDLVPSPPLEPEPEKRRLFEALTQFFTRLVGAGLAPAQFAPASRGQPQGGQPQPHKGAASLGLPLLIVIEDLHWSDDTSLEYLLSLAHRIASQPMLLLMTYRNDEVHSSLSHFLAELNRERLASELALNRLSRAEVDALIQAIFELGRPTYAEFLEPVYVLTEGNPFFVEEVLKSLLAAGDIFYADGKWARKPIKELHIPRSVQDAVRRRAQKLSEASHQILTLAAVAGRRFDFALLQHVAGVDEGELLQCIKQLMAAQLVVEESAEQFAFRHALTRQAIYADLLARERRALHRTIAETMEHVYADAPEQHLADLAYHYDEAGEWAKALAWAQRAGEQAQRLYTPQAAIEHFTRALEAAGHLTPRPPLPVGEGEATIGALHRSRGQAYETLGDFDAAHADYQQALTTAHAAQDNQAEWQSLLDLGFLWASRDYAQTGAYFQRALSLARTMGDPATLGHSLNRVGNWHVNVEEFVEALSCHQEALDIFEEIDDRHGLAETYDLLGVTSFLGNDLIRCDAYIQQAAQRFRELDDRPGLVSALASRMFCAGPMLADTLVTAALSLPEAIHAGEEAVQIARQIGLRSGEAFTLVVSAGCLATQGQYVRALELAQGSLAVAETIAHRQWLTTAHRVFGGIYLDLLALPLAHPHLEQALTLAREIGSLLHAHFTTGFLASLYVLQHDFARAESILDTVPIREGQFVSTAQRQCWCARAELALARGGPQAALHIVEQLIAAAPNMTAETVIPRLWHLRGEALAMLKRFDEAEAVLRAAQASAAAQGTRPMLWRIDVALGKVFLAQARAEQADEQFAQACGLIAELATNVPDQPLAEPLGQTLRDNFLQHALALIPPAQPLSPRRATKKEFGGLTAREREVAALIAQGKTSREIAEALVLSERTVEGYVGNILNKLGFTSRAQIAVWAVQKGLVKD